MTSTSPRGPTTSIFILLWLNPNKYAWDMHVIMQVPRVGMAPFTVSSWSISSNDVYSKILVILMKSGRSSDRTPFLSKPNNFEWFYICIMASLCFIHGLLVWVRIFSLYKLDSGLGSRYKQDEDRNGQTSGFSPMLVFPKTRSQDHIGQWC